MTRESHDYWVGHCEGFRVGAGGRRVGIVEEVVLRLRPELADSLVVRGGLFGNRLTLVPVEAVTDVRPREKRILVSPEWRPAPDPLLASQVLVRLRHGASLEEAKPQPVRVPVSTGRTRP